VNENGKVVRLASWESLGLESDDGDQTDLLSTIKDQLDRPRKLCRKDAQLILYEENAAPSPASQDTTFAPV
jgi:hypothetical protein